MKHYPNRTERPDSFTFCVVVIHASIRVLLLSSSLFRTHDRLLCAAAIVGAAVIVGFIVIVAVAVVVSVCFTIFQVTLNYPAICSARRFHLS